MAVSLFNTASHTFYDIMSKESLLDPYAVTFSTDSKKMYIYAGNVVSKDQRSTNKYILIYDLATLALENKIFVSNEFPSSMGLCSITISPDNKMAYTAGYMEFGRGVNLIDGTVKEYGHSQETPNLLYPKPDGKQIYAIYSDKIYVMDASTGAEVSTINIGKGYRVTIADSK